MTEDRPHRPSPRPRGGGGAAAAPTSTTAASARREVDAVLDAAGETGRPARPRNPAGLTDREVEVLRLIARGHANKQVAAALGISPKTVGRHVEHIYAKAGVTTRAGATLFAMEHGLSDRHGVNTRLPPRARSTHPTLAMHGTTHTRFDIHSTDGTSIAVWVAGRRTGDRDGPRLDRRPHHVRPLRRRARRADDDVLDGPARLRGQRRHAGVLDRARLRGRRRRRRRRRRTHRRTGRPVGPLLRRQLRDGRRRAQRQRRTTSCCTNRASGSPTRRDRSPASRPRSPRATTTPPSSPCSSTSWR